MIRVPRALSAVFLGASLAGSPSPALNAQSPPVSGTWVGSYLCAQGETGLRLTIQNPHGDALTATFAFYPLASSNAGLSSGSFAMTGSYYGSRVSLQQAHWINQPLGYVMVGLQGQVSAASFTGSVIGPGCSTFLASRATSYAAPPRVAVEASGFSQNVISSSTDISYGIELKNESLAMDAYGITVRTSFIDKYARSVATDSNTLIGIPAGKVFYYGGFVQSNVSLTVAAMHVNVQVDATQPKALVLPPVRGLNVSAATLGPAVTGQFTNPYHTQLPSDAVVYAVFIDANGKIVGGGQEPTQAQVQPGATVSFSVPAVLSSDMSDTVGASVDPCMWVEAVVDQCPVKLPPVALSPGY